MRISKVWTGFFHGIHGIFYVFFYTIAMLKFFSNYSSRSNLRVFYYFLESLWKILCIKRFYFLNYFIFFVIVFRIIRNMKETSSLINFSPQIFGMQISRCGQNFHRATITIFKHQLQTWIFKYIIFSNH